MVLPEEPTPNPDTPIEHPEPYTPDNMPSEQPLLVDEPLAPNVIEVPEETIANPDAPIEEPSEFTDAKAQFSEGYLKWNTLTPEEQESESGRELSTELTRLHGIIQKYEHPDIQVDPKEDPVMPETQEGGPAPGFPATVNDEDFKTATQTEPGEGVLHAEQTVDKAGRPAGFNQFYHGDAVPREGQDLLQFADATEMEKNKFRENR